MSCINCIPGKHGKVVASITNNDCMPCMPGTYRGINDNPGLSCKICDNGKYSNAFSFICKLLLSLKYSSCSLFSEKVRCSVITFFSGYFF